MIGMSVSYGTLRFLTNSNVGFPYVFFITGRPSRVPEVVHAIQQILVRGHEVTLIGRHYRW